MFKNLDYKFDLGKVSNELIVRKNEKFTFENKLQESSIDKIIKNDDVEFKAPKKFMSEDGSVQNVVKTMSTYDESLIKTKGGMVSDYKGVSEALTEISNVIITLFPNSYSDQTYLNHEIINVHTEVFSIKTKINKLQSQIEEKIVDFMEKAKQAKSGVRQLNKNDEEEFANLFLEVENLQGLLKETFEANKSFEKSEVTREGIKNLNIIASNLRKVDQEWRASQRSKINNLSKTLAELRVEHQNFKDDKSINETLIDNFETKIQEINTKIEKAISSNNGIEQKLLENKKNDMEESLNDIYKQREAMGQYVKQLESTYNELQNYSKNKLSVLPTDNVDMLIKESKIIERQFTEKIQLIEKQIESEKKNYNDLYQKHENGYNNILSSYRDQLDNIKEDISSLIKAKENYQKQNEKLQTDNEKQRLHIETINMRLSEVNKDLENKVATIRETNKQNSTLTDSLYKAQEIANARSQKIEMLKENLADLKTLKLDIEKSHKTKYEEQKETLSLKYEVEKTKETNKLDQKISKLETQKESDKKEYESSLRENTAMTDKEISKIQSLLDSQISENSLLNSQIKEKSQKIKDLENNIEKIRTDQLNKNDKESEKKIEQANKAIEKSKKDLDRMVEINANKFSSESKDFATFTTAQQEAVIKGENVQKLNKQLEETVKQLEKDIKSKKETIETLEKQIKNVQHENTENETINNISLRNIALQLEALTGKTNTFSTKVDTTSSEYMRIINQQAAEITSGKFTVQLEQNSVISEFEGQIRYQRGSTPIVNIPTKSAVVSANLSSFIKAFKNDEIKSLGDFLNHSSALMNNHKKLLPVIATLLGFGGSVLGLVGVGSVVVNASLPAGKSDAKKPSTSSSKSKTEESNNSTPKPVTKRALINNIIQKNKKQKLQ